MEGQLLALHQRCKDLATTFNHSTLLCSKLEEQMKVIHSQGERNDNQKMPKLMRLKQDVVTRWNSAFLMYESILVCKEGLRIVINGDAKIYKDHGGKMLTFLELDLLGELYKMLKQFYEFTQLMSASQYATISIITAGCYSAVRISTD